MVTTPRGNPVGPYFEDGFQTLLAFAADPDVKLWERTVQPPGIDGGDPIDITTMHNEELTTSAPRSLKSITASTMVVAYNGESLEQAMALINVNGWITAHLPDGSTYDFVGYLKSFVPNGHEIGGFPLANCQIIPTNQIDGVETPPEYTPAGS